MFLITLVSFIAEFLDSSLGMGYGTILSPVLQLANFPAAEVVTSLLIAETLSGIIGGFGHIKAGNLKLELKKFKEGPEGKSLLILVASGAIGVLLGTLLRINVNKTILSLVMGSVIISTGIYIFVTRNKNIKFSKTKLLLLGGIAAFNKTFSGGGYGPLVTGGQLVAGCEAKSAVGITSLAEGIISGLALIFFFLSPLHSEFTGEILPWVVFGSLLSVPFSVISVKNIAVKNIKLLISIACTCLGILLVVKTIF